MAKTTTTYINANNNIFDKCLGACVCRTIVAVEIVCFFLVVASPEYPPDGFPMLLHIHRSMTYACICVCLFCVADRMERERERICALASVCVCVCSPVCDDDECEPPKAALPNNRERCRA